MREQHLKLRVLKGQSLMLAAIFSFWLVLSLFAGETVWTPELQMKVKSIGNVWVSPDGKRVVYTVTEAVMTEEKSEYLSHLWLASTDGKTNFQFTYGEKSCTNPRWSPDGKWIAFTSSRAGKNNLYRIRVDGGEAEQLTEVKTGVGNFKWAPDGKSIAFVMSEPPNEEEEQRQKAKNDARVLDEDLKMNHLWLVTLEKDSSGKYPLKQLTKGSDFSVGGRFSGGFDWSPDGKEIVFAHTPTPRVDDWPKADISLVNVQSGEVRPLVQTEAAEITPLFSPDGKWIAYLASDIPPRWAFASTVHIIPATGGESRKLADTYDRNPNIIGWSRDGKYLFVTETHHTLTRIMKLPVNGKAYQDWDNGQWVIGSANLNRTGTYFGFSLQNLTTPPEAFVSPVNRFRPVRISRANQDMLAHSVPRTEVIRWKSVDDFEIEGLLTYPTDYQPGKRYPLLLVIHGGPAGVFRQTYLGTRYVYPVASFAQEGYFVLRCNIRGSSGYGQDFRYANYKDWGGKDFQDLMNGVDYVINQRLADPDRLGVMGWSYGGYMTSTVITKTDRFKAASVGAGVTDLVSFTGTADIPSFLPDYFGAEFWDNLQIYLSHSAIFNIKGVRTPTLIQHGEKDRRVPLGQGLELYNALKRQGVPVKMVVYPRTPHGPREPKLYLDVMKRNIEWFAKWILNRQPQP